MREPSLLAFALVVACSGGSALFGDQAAAGSGGTTSSGPQTANGSGGTDPLSSTGMGPSGSTANASSAAATSGMASSAMASSAMASTGSGQQDPCGNGKLDMGEACDDSNTSGGDGCSTMCALEGDANKCPTSAIIKLTNAVSISSTTSGKANITSTLCGGYSAPDLVFAVLPQKTAPITVQLVAPNFDRVLSVRGECANYKQCDACLDNSAQLNHTFQGATQNKQFYVVVTGHSGSNGPFTLHIHY